ncbi:hypothetical protein Tco_0373377 [Tanacetum coccineum]
MLVLASRPKLAVGNLRSSYLVLPSQDFVLQLPVLTSTARGANFRDLAGVIVNEFNEVVFASGKPLGHKASWNEGIYSRQPAKSADRCCAPLKKPLGLYPKTDDVSLTKDEKKIWKEFRKFDKDTGLEWVTFGAEMGRLERVGLGVEIGVFVCSNGCISGLKWGMRWAHFGAEMGVKMG